MTTRRTPARCTVYRVENAEGVGPYSSRTPPRLGKIAIYNAHEDAAHPAPPEDGLGALKWGDDDMCGLPSLPALRDWFAGWGAALEFRGFRVVAYRVPKHRVRYGQKQILFDRGNCKPVWSKTPSEARVW